MRSRDSDHAYWKDVQDRSMIRDNKYCVCITGHTDFATPDVYYQVVWYGLTTWPSRSELLVTYEELE